MPHLVERFGDVQRDRAHLLARRHSVDPVLRHVEQEVERGVPATKAELARVEELAYVFLEAKVHDGFEDLAHDGQQRDGAVLAHVVFAALFV